MIEMGVEFSNGEKSMDRKIKKLVAYAQGQANSAKGVWESEQDAVNWAKMTIEQGIRNLASSMFAFRK